MRSAMVSGSEQHLFSGWSGWCGLCPSQFDQFRFSPWLWVGMLGTIQFRVNGTIYLKFCLLASAVYMFDNLGSSRPFLVKRFPTC